MIPRSVPAFLVLCSLRVAFADDSPDLALLRRELGRDPLPIELLPEGRVRVGPVGTEERTLVQEALHLSQGGLVLLSSAAGLSWERDVDLRALLLGTGRPRDVLFVRTTRLGEVLRENEAEAPPEFEPSILVCIDRLGSAEWDERQKATDALRGFGQVALPYLRDGRSRLDDLEVRWRVDKIVADLTRQLRVEPGFLGIAYHYQELDPRDDPTLPRGAISIQQVLEGTAAQVCGLLPGDLVHAINEKPLANPLGTRKVTRIFEGLRAGEPITLSVLRDGRAVEIDARMGTYSER